MLQATGTHHVINHAHLFAGLGGGARGFNRASARVGDLTADFRCLGGIDVDPAAVRDFDRLAGVPGTVLDLFDREQYRAFHGVEPPAAWREAAAADIHRAFGHEHPHILFLSAPCKGFSGLLSETKSRTAKYQALNRLTLRGIWLALEAYADDPIELIVFENVPRIASRGRQLLDQIVGLLRAYGYAVAETTHDCGRLGGLAQSRKRFLLVARHMAKVPPFLCEPRTRPLRGVGDVLGRMPLPGDPAAGPMHRVPMLRWQTWVRLAFVEAGSDWRSLNKLRVEDGVLRDFALAPDRPWQAGVLGARAWDGPTGTVAGRSTPGNGAFSVADPRHGGPAKHSNEFRIVPWDGAGRSVTGAHGTGQCVADPRSDNGMFHNAFRVVRWPEASPAITGQHAPSNGAMCVADPRPNLDRAKGDDYHSAGHYGVMPWRDPAGAVSSAAGHDNGRWSVADPRPVLPQAADRLVAVIRSLNGCWHRPFTTAELCALQSLYDPEERMELDGLSDAAWRERIGNAVPPDAAQAIAETMGRTLLMAWSGETFRLSAEPIWVQPIAMALSVDLPA